MDSESNSTSSPGPQLNQGQETAMSPASFATPNPSPSAFDVSHLNVNLDAFTTYMEREVACTNNAWAILMVCGLPPFMVLLIWLIKTAKAHHDMGAPVGSFIVFGLAIAALAYFLFTRQTKKSVIGRQARSILMKLYAAKYTGGIKVGVVYPGGTIGYSPTVISPEAAVVLNEAARYTLEASSALNSPAWQNATGPRARARDDARASVDDAMSRIVVLATSTGNSPEVTRLVSDLKEVTAELVSTNRRLEESAGQARDGSLGLRATLEQLKEISRAEEEIFEHRKQL
jgi:hypothetical protein